MMSKYFSIIILSHNNKHIDLVLNSVLKQVHEKDEVIIVDDHSENDYLTFLNQLALQHKIKILHSVKTGNRSHNRNLGAKNSLNDILLFMDGDMVLIENALAVLRNAHESREEKAFIGPKHNIHYDEIHFKLFSGIDNYLSLLQTFKGQKQLASSYFLLDEREAFFDDNSNREFFWMHYYTGTSSVERSIFNQCGGFDESFETWGSEDVDLGYRIHFLCEIGFLKDFHSFHIPHKRNPLKIESSNLQNILKMLEKYHSWEFEVQYSFSGNPSIHKSMYYIVDQMRTLPLLDIQKIDPVNGSFMIINTISRKHPNGCILLGNAAKTDTIQQIGIALPYRTQSYDVVCISEHIFTYPPIITSRILQEAVRVGKKVYIQKMPDCIRINWNTNALIPTPLSNYRVAYHSDDIMDFDFNEDHDVINVVAALPKSILRSPKFLENMYAYQDHTEG